MIIHLAERDLKTKFGTFREHLYYDGLKESIAITMGDVAGGSEVLCRVHSHCVGAHVFNSVECDCREQMNGAQRAIQTEGRGVIIWLDQEGKGNGHLALMQSIPFKMQAMPQSEAYAKAGFSTDGRDYRAAAQILSDLQVRSIVLMANGPGKADDLRRAGIEVAATRPQNVSGADDAG